MFTFQCYNQVMHYTIRKMRNEDKNEVLAMMETFYSSDAVCTNGSAEIFDNDFKNCVGSNPYLDGYIFVSDDKVAMYLAGRFIFEA